jgi:histidine phosphotransferase ChpT
LKSTIRGQADLQRGSLADMSEAERLKLAELVSSRVCESLIGPIGAVVNGIELLRLAPDRRATHTQIDRDCARIVDRLRFFRLAYGCDDDELPVALHDLQTMAQAFFAETRIELDWPVPQGIPADPTAGVDRNAARVLLNGLLVIAECLGMRGTVAVHMTGEDPAAPSQFQVIGAGDLLPMSAAKCRTLQSDVRVAYLDEQTIQPYLAGQLARHTGIGFTVAVDPHRIEAAILLPRAADDDGEPVREPPGDPAR